MTTIQPPKNGNFLFTSESVNEGHPDKLCDQVSDAILDACLAEDPDSRVACETCTKTGMVMVFGEITTSAKNFNYEDVVRQTCKNIGYDHVDKGLDYSTMVVMNKLEAQSPDIGQAVHGNNTIKQPEEIGAGDQGHMFGYATDETPELMPFTHSMATQLGFKLTEVRKNGVCPWVRPDGKTQVTCEYRRCPDSGSMLIQRVHTILISTQHSPDVTADQIKNDIMEFVIKPIVPAKLLDENTIYHINPSGRFVIGGPHGDAGLTGRKIIIDTYGGWGAHGGGAFSGKDTTKVDRSAAYACRHAAKSLVANGFARRCLVQVSYAIGVVQPLSMFVDSYGSARFNFTDDDLCEILKRNFDFRPGCIQRDLNLKVPQFTPLAAYGHFGRSDISPKWEIVKSLTYEIPHSKLGYGTLLGMGNPLLDMSCHVDPALLAEYSLNGNDAILADSDTGKHDSLYTKLQSNPKTMYIAGGATQNSIRVAQWCLKNEKGNLKNPTISYVAYIGAVGDDANGKKLEDCMKREDCNAYYYRKTDVPTGICATLLTNNGTERSLVTKLDAANCYDVKHLVDNFHVLEKANVVYSAGFFMTVSEESMLCAAQHCLDKKKIYCLNLSAPFLMQVPPFKATLMKLIPFVDVLFGNETEAKTFAETESWGNNLSVQDIASKLSMLPTKKSKPRTVVITQGCDPTIIAVHGHTVEYPIIKLEKGEVVDTNGAGDAYVGGYLSKLVQGCTPDVCAGAGAAAASVIVRQNGTSFP